MLFRSGGYQMLGTVLEDPDGGESGGQPAAIAGLGLLDVQTRFYPEKRVTRTQASALLSFAAGEEVDGYEIHMGQSVRGPGCSAAFTLNGGNCDGAVSACGTVWGTYLHGVFERPAFRRAWLNTLRQRLGWQPLGATAALERGHRFDALADAVGAALDMQAVYRLLSLSGPRGRDV